VATQGVVRVWHAHEGWGVLDSEVTPGGCWAHFSSIRMPGYKSLLEGQEVAFDFEAANQDGYDFRAVDVRPSGDAREREPDDDPSAGYRSSLTIELRPPGETST
jgi:CspA family cold shock protein